MAEGVGCDSFLDFGFLGGFFDGSLKGGFVDVMALDDAGTGVFGNVGGGEDVLPKPVMPGVGVFLGNGVREVDSAEAFGEVLLVDFLNPEEVLA